MDPELKDIVGNTFAVGDKVATDVMSYKTSYLRVGEVVGVEPSPRGEVYVRVRYEASGTRRSLLRRPSGVVKVAS